MRERGGEDRRRHCEKRELGAGGVRVEGVQRRRWRKCERRELGMEEGVLGAGGEGGMGRGGVKGAGRTSEATRCHNQTHPPAAHPHPPTPVDTVSFLACKHGEGILFHRGRQ